MLLIGDVHGRFDLYRAILKQNPIPYSLQLGDMGVGFPNSTELNLQDIPGKHYWIAGNHDNPSVAYKHPNNLGKYGILPGSFINGIYDKLFFLSGAWSIDYMYRTENVTWWPNEQLCNRELENSIDLYKSQQPKIVCTHDCPTSVLYELKYSRLIPTVTSQALDIMFLEDKPDYWFFAHHHKSWRKNINGCWFICLNE
jgi:predicted phosphodiesterase